MEQITFGTDGWRATLDEFTEQRVRMVAQGVASYLRNEGIERPIAVGYDARETSQGFAIEIARVLCANGFDVVTTERDRPTPLYAFSVVNRSLGGAVVITASHNPPEYNGVKFIPSDGAPAKPAVMDAIEARLADPDPLPESEHGSVRREPLVCAHADHALALVESIADGGATVATETETEAMAETEAETETETEAKTETETEAMAETETEAKAETETEAMAETETEAKAETEAENDVDAADLTVAYDAMHGSGRGVTDALLERAEWVSHVDRIRCDRDPTFGGIGPEPAPASLESLLESVTNGDADIGIANDGDADRLAVVTPDRGYLDENLFFAALYEYLLETDRGPAVRTVSTTYLIDRIGEAHGETVYEVPVGFKWVADAMAEYDALVGGEESGGFSVRGHVREKDGVLLSLLATAMHAAEPLDRRVDRLLDTHGTVVQDKTSVACPDREKDRVLTALEGTIPDSLGGTAVADVGTADGFKLVLDDGSWILVRPSGTEPVLRVYAEAETADRVETLLSEGTTLVESHV